MEEFRYIKYTISVTNTGSQTAKSVVIKDAAPDHIEFLLNDMVNFKDKLDSACDSKNFMLNVGDIEPSETVNIVIPVKVVA